MARLSGQVAVIFKNSRPAILYAGNKITRAIKSKHPVIAPAIKKLATIIERKYT